MNFKKLLVVLLCLPLTVLADAEAGREKAQICAACHGIRPVGPATGEFHAIGTQVPGETVETVFDLAAEGADGSATGTSNTNSAGAAKGGGEQQVAEGTLQVGADHTVIFL